MVSKASIVVTLACAGLGSATAGFAIHAAGRSRPAVTADRVAPWGRLAAVSVPVEASPGLSEQALKSVQPAPAEGGAVATVTDAVPASAEQTVAAVSPEAVTGAAPAADPGPPPAAGPSPAPAPTDTRASVDDAVPAVSPDSSPAASAAPLLDINTASMAALNTIPGMGRIGRAIVSHRPYHSLSELTSRRVLRSGDFTRVKDKLKV